MICYAYEDDNSFLRMVCLIVGNSIVKYWYEHAGDNLKIVCLPGAKLDQIMEEALKEIEVGPQYQFVFLQSGIPDLHDKGSTEIHRERLSLYKGRLEFVRKIIPNAVLLLIYPPLHSSQYVCNTYNDLNKFIRDLNHFPTPNTVSRIFHRRSSDDRWRVDYSRMVDGIHLRGEENSRIIGKIYEFVELSTHNDSVRRSDEGPVQQQNHRGPVQQAEKKRMGDQITVTVEDSSVSGRVEMLLQEKRKKLEDLRIQYEKDQKKIEEECIQAIQKVVGGEEQVKKRRVISSTVTYEEEEVDHLDPEYSEDVTYEEEEVDPEHSEDFITVDEYHFTCRDIREEFHHK